MKEDIPPKTAILPVLEITVESKPQMQFPVMERPDPDSNTHHSEVCGNCGNTYGQHYGTKCPHDKGQWKWKEKESEKKTDVIVDEIDDATRQRLIEFMKDKKPEDIKGDSWGCVLVAFDRAIHKKELFGNDLEYQEKKAKSVRLWLRAKTGEFSPKPENTWKKWTIEELRNLPTGTRIEHRSWGLGTKEHLQGEQNSGFKFDGYAGSRVLYSPCVFWNEDMRLVSSLKPENPWKIWTLDELKALREGTRVEHKKHGFGQRSTGIDYKWDNGRMHSLDNGDFPPWNEEMRLV